MKKIILASSSPRRKEILKKTGLKFVVDAGDYMEDMNSGLNPGQLAKFLSLNKAKSVSRRHRNAIIIAVDTFIVINGKLLGKALSISDARRMLLMLNNKPHKVITGFTILDTESGKNVSRHVQTKIHFRKLSTKEIEDYLKSKESIGKAGGYAIQGIGAVLIKKIEGDFYNAMGLPQIGRAHV